MKISPMDFFNKTKIEEENIKEEATQSESSKNNQPILRGPGGKFISKKALEQDKPQEKTENESESEISLEPEQKQETKSQEEAGEIKIQEKGTDEKMISPSIQFSIFRGTQIRKFYKNGKWFFSITDILTTAKIIDMPNHLLKIKKAMEDNKISAEIIETFSVDEEKIECITYDSYIQLLPVMRTCETSFPGPFPDWLMGVSKLPKENY